MDDSTTDRPRALLVFESMFGCTEHIARAVAAGLEDGGFDVRLENVAQADAGEVSEVDLLVVGAPTHAFSLSRPNTRQEAVRKGAPEERAGTGLREWIGSLADRDAHRPPVAAFDTRVTKVRHLPKAASTRAAKLLSRAGYPVAARPAPFFVDDLTGPITEGELDRARAWGRRIALAIAHRQPGTATG